MLLDREGRRDFDIEALPASFQKTVAGWRECCSSLPPYEPPVHDNLGVSLLYLESLGSIGSESELSRCLTQSETMIQE